MKNQIIKRILLLSVLKVFLLTSPSRVCCSSTSFNLNDVFVELNSVNDYEFYFDVDETVCMSDEYYSWNQSFPQPTSGSYEVTLTSSEGTDILVQVTSTLVEVTLPIYPGAVTWVISDVSPSSSWSSDGSLIITTQNEHLINLVPFDSICNNTIGDTLVYLSELIEDQPAGRWFLNGIEVVEDYVSFSGNPSILHELSFSTVGFESLCPGYEASFSFIVYSCDCINVYLEDKYYCNSQDQISQFDIFTGFGYQYEISILNSNNLVDPIEKIAGNFILKDKSPGVYQIYFEYNGIYDTTCQESYTAELLLEAQYEADVVDSSYLFCGNAQDEFNLNSYLSGSSGVGSWFLNNLEIDSIISFSDLDIGLNEFNYLTGSFFACVTDSISLDIVNSSSPSLEITEVDVTCFGENNGAIEVNIVNEEYGPFSLVLNDEIIDNKELIEDLSAGEYQLFVSNEWGCSAIVEDIIIEEPNLLEVSLGEDKAVELNDSVTIEAVLNILLSEISNISWSDLEGVIDEDDLILVRKAIENSTLVINVVDKNGCTDSDEIKILLLDKNIELPNVINLNSNNFLNKRFGIPKIPSIARVNTLQIYDRWGALVFKRENFASGNEASYWDGTFKGKQVMQGVFAYYVEYENHFGELKELIGSVTVVK